MKWLLFILINIIFVVIIILCHWQTKPFPESIVKKRLLDILHKRRRGVQSKELLVFLLFEGPNHTVIYILLEKHYNQQIVQKQFVFKQQQ